MHEFRRGAWTFDVIDRGPDDGPPVVLLHGFPQLNTSWNAVIERLVAQGYRCLAPNQRGYSPGARPPHRRDYVFDELVADVVALIDEAGLPKVHLVGHDWGAAVAWGMAAQRPDRLATITALSVPHPAAFLKSLTNSRQGLASWYMYAFQLPGIPEKVLLRGNGRTLARFLSGYGGQPTEAAQRDARAMTSPGALTGGLNWYRALPFTNMRQAVARITVPTMYVWSDGDTAVLEKGARDCGHYVTGEYRFETLHGVSHWMLDELPEAVAGLLLEWLAAHPL